MKHKIKYLKRAGEFFRFDFENEYLYDVAGNPMGNFSTICQILFDPATKKEYDRAQIEYFKNTRLVWEHKGRKYTNFEPFQMTPESENLYFSLGVAKHFNSSDNYIPTRLVDYKGKLYFSEKSRGDSYVILYDMKTLKKKVVNFNDCSPIMDLETFKLV